MEVLLDLRSVSDTMFRVLMNNVCKPLSRRRNTGLNTRDTVRDSYEFALKHVGQDKDAGQIWDDYIEFLKAGDPSSTWEEQQKNGCSSKDLPPSCANTS